LFEQGDRFFWLPRGIVKPTTLQQVTHLDHITACHLCCHFIEYLVCLGEFLLQAERPGDLGQRL
jgi:hypothetical protein